MTTKPHVFVLTTPAVPIIFRSVRGQVDSSMRLKFRPAGAVPR